MLRKTILAAALGATPAAASDCFQYAQAPGQVWNASFTELEDAQVGLRFVGHSSWMLVTHEGLTILTDWSGDYAWKIEDVTADVVTMNHAHETHWTPNPDPAIEHVLKGWGSGGKPAEHELYLGETLIRNVPTDIRSYGGEPFGNSIFVFEHGGLCIGHLGHLHHEPTEEQYAMIGRLDVVMAPVDGSFTLPVDRMVDVMERLKARVVLPMHAFGALGLGRFLAGMEEGGFEVEMLAGDTLVLSAKTLPEVPTVMVPKGL